MQSQKLWLPALGDGDILVQQTEHALAVTRCGGLSGPEAREVCRELQDLLFLVSRDGTQCLPLEIGQFGLQLKQALHRVVPALLERGGDQAVAREIGRASCRERV